MLQKNINVKRSLQAFGPGINSVKAVLNYEPRLTHNAERKAAAKVAIRISTVLTCLFLAKDTIVMVY